MLIYIENRAAPDGYELEHSLKYKTEIQQQHQDQKALTIRSHTRENVRPMVLDVVGLTMKNQV